MEDPEEVQPEMEENLTEDTIFNPDDFSQDAFQKLLNDNNKAIRELQANQMFVFAENIKNLLTLLENFYQNYHENQSKISEMAEKVKISDGKVEQAMKISQNDHDVIQNLKSEVKTAWKLADAANEREQDTHELLFAAREKLKKYEKHATKFETTDIQNEELPPSLQEHKQGLLLERDRLQAEVEELNKRLILHRLYTSEVEKKAYDAKQEFQKLVSDMDDLSNEQFKDRRQLEQSQTALREVTAERDILTEDIRHFKNLVVEKNRSVQHLHDEIATQKLNFEKLSHAMQVKTNKMTKLAKDLEIITEMKNKLTTDFNVKVNLLKLKEDESKKVNIENVQLVKDKESLMKKLGMALENVSNRDQEILKLKSFKTTLEKEVEIGTKAIDKATKYAEKLQKEKEVAYRDLIKAQNSITELHEKISLLEQQIKTMDSDIKSHIATEQRLKTIITKTEKERDRHLEEAQIIENKLENAKEEIEQKSIFIAEQKEKLAEMQLNVNQVQTLFEDARNERNVFQRDLEQCKKELSIKGERLKNSSMEVEQLRSDIQTKLLELIHSKKIIEKFQKEQQSLQATIQRLRSQLGNTKDELQASKVLNSQLRKTIVEDEENISRLRKCKDSLLQEKDLIGTQLVRRNDEINILKEKISIQTLALDRGESQYGKRLDDIRLLKVEIQNLTSKCDLLARDAINTADMRQEVIQLNRALTQERVKVKALEDEMLTPTNVHRWRKLLGNDPEKLELLEKTTALQKLLLIKTSEASDRERMMAEYRKLLSEMTDFIKKEPAKRNALVELNKTKRDLRNMTKKAKALEAELRVTNELLDARENGRSLSNNEEDHETDNF
ncbi:cilia- and flagella-associated protein 58-like [Culicoides brevitarsis]|uniref:cilia- and flagella-associated protein 58-like n=1 Tax=Culicoides brevitarsis TaxID=469753 RepID=UPI00307C79E2